MGANRKRIKPITPAGKRPAKQISKEDGGDEKSACQAAAQKEQRKS
ncbi:MAG: hypothetical protein KatS3mg105_2781 [Gemmatales bacterium]|nr:MAG: hypothetical protein KatS3mg105_2781 [Gemmatales bacterium]